MNTNRDGLLRHGSKHFACLVEFCMSRPQKGIEEGNDCALLLHHILYITFRRGHFYPKRLGSYFGTGCWLQSLNLCGVISLAQRHLHQGIGILHSFFLLKLEGYENATMQSYCKTNSLTVKPRLQPFLYCSCFLYERALKAHTRKNGFGDNRPLIEEGVNAWISCIVRSLCAAITMPPTAQHSTAQ